MLLILFQLHQFAGVHLSQSCVKHIIVIGALSLLVLPLWLIYASDTPENNARISVTEQQYIMRSLKDQVYTREKRKVSRYILHYSNQ